MFLGHEVKPVRLGELSDVLTISRGVPTQATALHGEFPVFSVPELLNWEPPGRFISGPELTNLERDPAIEDDIWVCIEGSAAGEVFVVPEDFDRVVPSQQVAVIRVRDRSQIDPWYLGAFLSTENARNQIRRLARGQKVQRIAVKDLDTVTIPICPPQLQSTYAQHYRTFQRAIRAHREAAEHLAAMCAASNEMNFLDDSN